MTNPPTSYTTSWDTTSQTSDFEHGVVLPDSVSAAWGSLELWVHTKPCPREDRVHCAMHTQSSSTKLVLTMAEATARQRVIALVLYTIILMVVHYFVVQPSFLPSEKVLWLFNGVARSPLWQPVAEPALYTARRRGDQWLPGYPRDAGCFTDRHSSLK